MRRYAELERRDLQGKKAYCLLPRMTLLTAAPPGDAAALTAQAQMEESAV